MGNFSLAMDFVLRWETGGDPAGGLTQDPLDPGGTTRWGISQRSHPELVVETLTRPQAEAVYLREYWGPLRATQMHDAPALAVFDWAVHSGRSIAVRQLQRALEIEPDGLIGKDTLTAMQKRDPVELAVALTMARARHQGKLVLANTALARFVGGWGARLVDLTATVSRMV